MQIDPLVSGLNELPSEAFVMVEVPLVGKPVRQKSTAYSVGGYAERAVDGNTDGNYVEGNSCTHTGRKLNQSKQLPQCITSPIHGLHKILCRYCKSPFSNICHKHHTAVPPPTLAIIGTTNSLYVKIHEY